MLKENNCQIPAFIVQSSKYLKIKYESKSFKGSLLEPEVCPLNIGNCRERKIRRNVHLIFFFAEKRIELIDILSHINFSSACVLFPLFLVE